MHRRTRCSTALRCNGTFTATCTRSVTISWTTRRRRAATRTMTYRCTARACRKALRSSTCCDAMATAAELDDPIPISALQHAVYCLRQAALIHIERAWAENHFTAEGRVLHDAAHEARERKGRRGVRRVTAL